MFQAKDLMTLDTVTVGPDDTIDLAVSLMIEHQIAGLPVLDEAGHLVGIVTEFDLLQVVCDYQTVRDRVRHFMTTQTCTVSEDEDWVSVADVFRATNVRRLPVMRGEQLVGILARHDLMWAIQRARRQIRQELSEAQPRRAATARKRKTVDTSGTDTTVESHGEARTG